MSNTVRRSIEIQAPPEDVWPVMVDPDRELEWRSPEITEVEQLDDGPLRPGVRFRGSAEVMGQSDTWVNELTTVKEPHVLAWKTVETTAPAWAPGRYELEETAQGTRATIHVDYEPRTLKGRLLLPLVTRFVSPRVIGGFLEQLRDLAEAREPAR